MPDIYAKGEPHKPTTTITGHFVGMHPAGPLVDVRPATVWYRGDEYVALKAERDELTKQIAIGVKSQFDEGIHYERRIGALEAEIAKLKDDINVAPQRRPPKRAS